MARVASNPWWNTSVGRHPVHCERAIYVDGIGMCPEHEPAPPGNRGQRPGAVGTTFWPRLFGLRPHRNIANGNAGHPEAAGTPAPAGQRA